MRNARTFVAVILVALLAASAYADEKIVIKPNITPNLTWKMTMTTDTNMNLKVSANGQDQNMVQKINMALTAESTALAVADGVPTKVKMSFGNDCKISMDMMGRHQDVPFPLAGKSMTVTTNPDGTVDVDPPSGFDASTKATLKNMLESGKDFFPGKPVGPGDSWDVKSEAVAKMFQMTDAKGGMSCTLNKISTRDGRKVAELSVKGNPSGNLQGMDVAVDLSGTVNIDVATGQALDSDILATMTLKGNAQMPVSGTGTVTSKQTITLVK